MKQNPVITTNALTIGYLLKGGQRKVVHEGLDLQLRAGEVTCLLGLNGAGKSTLLRTLCGFQPPLQGEIYLSGKALDSYSRASFAMTLGVVLTEKTNAGGLTVYELVSLGRHPYTGFWGRLRDTDRQIIEDSMEAVGIAHKASQFVSELSDGERQKAMIAKVLAQQCPVILLDEPTAFLDVTSRIETMALLHRLAVEQQKAILLSTHDLDLAIQMADCLWLLAKDKPMVAGSPEDLILQGAFTSFFDRGMIHFDSLTGKLNLVQKNQPVLVRGESNLVYWLGNALKRNGFDPMENGHADIEITAQTSSRMLLHQVGREPQTFTSVASLMEYLKDMYSFIHN